MCKRKKTNSTIFFTQKTMILHNYGFLEILGVSHFLEMLLLTVMLYHCELPIF